jgi:AcrR family transcriptional regulator
MSPAAHKTKTRQAREQSRRRILEAAAALVPDRSYAELTVDEVMSRAGIGRTLFYRHFDDLADLLIAAGREAVDELYAAQLEVARVRTDYGPESIRAALEAAASVYARHGPILRAVAEAAASDERVAAGQARMRERFDEFAAPALRAAAAEAGREFADVDETARALNLLNEHYLLDVFGHAPRVSIETAVRTLGEIWVAVLRG